MASTSSETTTTFSAETDTTTTTTPSTTTTVSTTTSSETTVTSTTDTTTQTQTANTTSATTTTISQTINIETTTTPPATTATTTTTPPTPSPTTTETTSTIPTTTTIPPTLSPTSTETTTTTPPTPSTITTETTTTTPPTLSTTTTETSTTTLPTPSITTTETATATSPTPSTTTTETTATATPMPSTTTSETTTTNIPTLSTTNSTASASTSPETTSTTVTETTTTTSPTTSTTASTSTSPETTTTDIDECLLKSHNCDVNAFCKNTIGSFICTCKPGYTGDGRTCTDDDECGLNTNDCSDNADCNNTQGSYVCVCKSGYTGDGKICSESNQLLLPYDTDSQLSFKNTKDECVATPDFECPINVGDVLRRRMYVCENGIVTFNGKYATNAVPKTKRDEQVLQQKAIVAPYFSNINASSSGRVYYRAYSAEEYKNDTTVNETIGDVLQSAGYGTLDVFKVVAVSWVNVVEHNGPAANTSTFQLIIVTDGLANSLAFFSYGNMKFTSRENLIGFATELSQSYRLRVTDPVSEYNNLGRKGFVWFSLNSGLDSTISTCMQCRLWARGQQPVLSYLQPSWNSIPQCPCDQGTILFSGFFQPFYFTGWTTCYIFRSSGRFNSRGSICCYKGWLNRGGFISGNPDAGFKTPYSQFSVLSLYNDLLMKDACCAAGLCDVFYSVRPRNNICSTRTLIRRGRSVGDPHILTPDGKEFTFNGYGEYKMLALKTDDFTIDIQARTEPYVNEEGKSVGATIFTAFAGRENVSGVLASFTIELDPVTKSGLQIKVNGRSYTAEYNQEVNFNRSLNTVSISKPRAKAVEVFFIYSSIRVEIEEGYKLLKMSLSAPNEFAGKAKGLYGNINGNSSDDFVFPNGTVLPPNSTEKEIFSYGQSWLITQDSESVFDYKPGASFRNYQNVSYVPNYLDEANQTLIDEAKKSCGEANKQCVFDKVFTGSDAVAIETKVAVIEAEETQQLLENESPSLSLDADAVDPTTRQIHVYNGVPKLINLIGKDDGVNLIYNITNGSGVLDLGSETGKNRSAIITFTSSEPVVLSVTVTDDKGVQALLELPIILCTNCSNNGTCTFNQTRDGAQAGFSLALCECDVYYDGLDCEKDFDGCAADPCSLGRNCSDNNVTTHSSSGKAYTCEDCPTGYTKNNLEDCEDVNECSSSPCSDVCSNNVGSYECTCFSGRRASNATHCVDINECEEATHDCEQICNNIDRGFTCDCLPGYKYNSTENICSSDNIALCSNLTCNSTHGGCYVEDETPQCFCKNGYRLENNTCLDINECEQKVCAHTCNNNAGSYICSCFTGYILNSDKTTCRECPAGRWGNDCTRECGCSSQGADRCDHVRGCVCKPGWEGEKCTMSTDECLQTNVCNDTLKSCVDTVGSFRCDCKSGYRLNSTTSKCQDVNECADVNLNTCQQTCINTLGGFSCSCMPGYKKNTTDPTKCIDINECEVGGTGCAHMCENAEGSYNCLCLFGYALNSDQKTCIKMSAEDVCLQKMLNCSGYCAVTANAAQCACGDGYTLAADDHQACIDIDECKSSTLNKCRVPDSCKNTAGGYTCSCPSGQFLENDGVACTVCDDYHYGENCSLECDCFVGAERCDPVSGCVCHAGWTGTKCDADKNECDAEKSPCKGENMECVNTPGNYTCQCLSGFNVDADGNCTNIDECKDSQLNTCSQTCTDNDGSYTCSCREGFEQSGEVCIDVNECKRKHDCSQVCINVEGSYKCSCNPGFVLSTTDRTSCIAETECASSSTCGNNTVCVRVNETDVCQCIKGFEKEAPSDTVCKDIDECSPSPCINGSCSNSDGGFSCTCANGYKLSSDFTTCVECASWQYGMGCTEPCTCLRSNTDSCDSVDGSCECKAGWNGTNCSIDIDECTAKSAQCPGNSTCKNVDGSYVCECYKGFVKTSSGLCQVCDANHFGQDCGEPCDCEAANTMMCDNVNGTCYCKNGWTGSECADDIDECENNNPCNATHRTNCENTNGSYICRCDSGYELSVDDVCVDTNECQRGLSNCTQKCTNTDGGFNCSCYTGYTGDGYNCTACSDGTYGDNCNHVCACVKNNTVNSTEVCDHVTGNCACMEHWKGKNCDVDKDECDESTHNCTGENQGCFNKIEGFGCDCLYGYVLQNDSCVNETADTITTTAPVITSIKMVLTFNINITEPFTAAHKKEIRSQLDALYRKKITDIDFTIEITNLRTGSVIVEFKILFLKTNVDDFVVAILAVASTQTQIFIFGKAANLTGYEVSDIDVLNNTSTTEELLCLLYTASSPDCTSDTVCIITNDKPQCEPKKTEDNLPLILGLGVGIPAFFLALATVLLCMIFYQRHRKAKAKKWKYGDNISSASEEEVSPPRFYKRGSGIGPFLKQPGITGYPDMSYTSRDVSSDDYGARSMDTGPVNGKSSWDFLFRLSSNVPLDETFRIKRPQVDKIPRL